MNRPRLIFMVISSVTVLALLSLAVLVPSTVRAEGARQISGIGYFAAPGECTETEGLGATYAVKMTGDLVGCHYVFVTGSHCSPSGTYVEEGNEYFVSATNANDTFRTRYEFEAKYTDCSTATGEIFGRCQHPISKDKVLGHLQIFRFPFILPLLPFPKGWEDPEIDGAGIQGGKFRF